MIADAPSGYHVYCPTCARVLGVFLSSLGDAEAAERRARDLAATHFHTNAKVLVGVGDGK